LKRILNDKSIEWEKSISFAQDQNDVSERAIRTVIKKARILLIAANLSKRLWPETLSTTCYLSNRSLIKTLDEKILYETWYDENLIFRICECTTAKRTWSIIMQKKKTRWQNELESIH
jgi:hypothetical protein